MIQQIRAVLNPSFGEHFKITWASIAASTSWTQARLYFGDPELEHFRVEPSPTANLRNPLEATIEERWERYLEEGVQETSDLSFSTPSWAGTASRPHLPSGQPEAQHLTEANSVPSRFTRINRKTTEEQEATSKYETPAESEKRQTIDEELGAQVVTTINKDWYTPSEAEVASAIQSILDLTQPMDVDQPLEEQPYQMFSVETSDVLGPDQGSRSPVTANENRFLDTPGGFSRAQRDGRPPTGSPAGSSGHRIMGRTAEDHQ